MAVTISGSGVVTGLDSEGSSDLGTKLEAAGGLVMVTPTTIANSGGSATLTAGAVAFSGVTSVSLNGCFTSVYDNYALVFSNTTTTTSGNLHFRLRVSGSDNSTSNYRYAAINGAVSGVQSSGGSNGDTKATLAYWTGGGFNSLNNFQISSPALVSHTSYSTTSMETGANVYCSTTSGAFNATTQFDGLTIFPASGSATGSIRVYGYRNGI